MRLVFLILFIFCVTGICEAETFGDYCRHISNFLTGSSDVYTPNMSDVHSVTKKAIEDAKREKISVKETADKIGGLVGRCVIDPPDEIEPSKLKGPINYDSLVLPYMTGLKAFPTVAGPNSTDVGKSEIPLMVQARDLNIPGLNAQSLIEIDALARTIYAEMAECAPIGDEYLLAVARVIKNRANAVETKRGEIYFKDPNASSKKLLKAGREFINKEEIHWPGKNITSKVTSSPVQFSAWNSYVIDFDSLRAARRAEIKKLSKKMSVAKATQKAEAEIKPNAKTRKFYKFNESGLLQTLCPPSDKTKKFYSGGKPSAALNSIWKSTLRVAVEAALYPEEFNARTSQLANVLNYTSNREEFLEFEQVHPKIDGRKIDNDRCLNLWVAKSAS